MSSVMYSILHNTTATCIDISKNNNMHGIITNDIVPLHGVVDHTYVII